MAIHGAIEVTLSAGEWSFVRALRATARPASRGPRGGRLVGAALGCPEAPRCPEMQADGVPCERADADCDTCPRASGGVRQR